MRSEQPVATELSGGLDSSFVTCLARDNAAGPLHTVSAVFKDTPEADEREYIKAVLETSDKFVPHTVDADATGLLETLNEICSSIDEGVYLAGGHHIMWQNYKCAGSTGANVLLTGVDGDSVVDYGLRILFKLAEEKEWSEFGRVTRELNQRYSQTQGIIPQFMHDLRSPWGTINRFARGELKSLIRKRDYIEFHRAGATFKRELSLPMSSFYRNFVRELISSLWPLTENTPQEANGSQFLPIALNNEFADRINYTERYRAAKKKKTKKSSTRENQVELLQSGTFAMTLECVDQYAAAHSVQPAHPYMDKRLVEYAVALPPEQSLDGGWTRAIMRRAMQGIVPDVIKLRPDKGYLNPSVHKQLLGRDKDLLRELIYNPGSMKKYVDPNYIHDLYGQRSQLNGQGVWRLGFFASLSYWMNTNW